MALTSAAPETASERRRAEGRRGRGSSSPWREEGKEWAERGSRRRWHRAAAASSRRREGVEHEGSAPLSGDVWRREGRRRSDQWELGIGRECGEGLGLELVGAPAGLLGGRMGRPGLCLSSLSLILFSRKELERRKEREG